MKTPRYTIYVAPGIILLEGCALVSVAGDYFEPSSSPGTERVLEASVVALIVLVGLTCFLWAAAVWSRGTRFTIRTLMIVIATIASALGCVVERHSRFSRLAAFHKSCFVEIQDLQVFRLQGPCEAGCIINGRPVSFREGRYVAALNAWHEELSQKYSLAAKFPWLPVARDAPRPE